MLSPSSSLGALDRALQEVGDRWSLLVIGALAEQPRRFNELQQLVPGIAPNILARRLRDLEASALVVASPYQDRPVRMAYRLSATGAELAGVLAQLAAWGSTRAVRGPHDEVGSRAVRHLACGTPLETRWWCPTCVRVADPADTGDLHDV
ncbi:MAG: winged helix-turn-helix transcriptional regulator [Acidimicrobiia bacterium]